MTVRGRLETEPMALFLLSSQNRIGTPRRCPTGETPDSEVPVTPIRPWRAVLLRLSLGCGLLLSSPGGPVLSADAAVPPLALEPIATGLNDPVSLAHAGDGSGRLFIVERAGKIKVYDGAQVLGTPFLDISSLVSCCGERGLLGLAFHPDYANNGYFYVFYTTKPEGSLAEGDVVIARYQVSGNPQVANGSSRLILVTIPHSTHGNHNGGQLAFGPDGHLYAGVGDGGGGGDPDRNAQDLGVLLGKILRIDVDGAPPYVPADNPFVGTPGARGEIWALGLRNPWRFGFDRATGDLFIGDVGQGSREEVDFEPADSLRRPELLLERQGRYAQPQRRRLVHRGNPHRADPRVRDPRRRELCDHGRVSIPGRPDPGARRGLCLRRFLLGPDMGREQGRQRGLDVDRASRDRSDDQHVRGGRGR